MAFLIALVAAAGVIIWTQGVHAKRAAHHKLVAERTKTAAPSLPPAQAQAQAQPAAEAAAWKQVEIEPGQTLGAAFDKAGLDASNLAWVLAHTTDKAPLQDVHPGARFWFKVGAQGQFEGIRYYRNATTRVTLLHKGGAAQTQIADLAARRQRHAAWGIIHTTLSGSAAKKAVPIPVVARVTHLFKRNLDFRDLRSGSYFAVIYSDIKSVADPRPFDSQVLAAEVHADGHTFTAYRFEMKPGHAAYYTRGGVPLIHPTLWRYPVHYTYMSSPFGMRVDPVVHRYQLHQGIDLAAPLGTPIHAAGNGVITYQGWAHGYGKYVTIRNTPSYTTGYAHLARFAAGEHIGSHVKQGEVIGYVGNTGFSTGPHLEYETFVNGRPVNPLTVAQPKPTPLSGASLAHFKAQTAHLAVRMQRINHHITAVKQAGAGSYQAA